MHRHDVLPVDGHARHVVRDRPPRDVRHRARVGRRHAHRIAVVLAQVDDRQRPHAHQVQRLVEHALVRRAVAEEAQAHAVGAQHARGQPRAGRHRDRRRDDPRLAERADREVGQVHRAALAAADAGRLAHELGHERTQRIAIGCPCDRCVPVIVSPSRVARHAPTTAASCPIDRCSIAGISPFSISAIVASSKSRTRSMRRSISAARSGAGGSPSYAGGRFGWRTCINPCVYTSVDGDPGTR